MKASFYKNGKREMANIFAKQKSSVPLEGFMPQRGRQVYSRRHYNDLTRNYELIPVVYANATQAENRAKKLQKQGISCSVIKGSKWMIVLS